MHWIRSDNISLAYQQLLAQVQQKGIPQSPRDIATRELRNCLIEITVPCNELPVIASTERQKKMRKYAAAEGELYETGTLVADEWSTKASKFWGKLADSYGLINSNYGFLIQKVRDARGKTQWEWAKHCLEKDPDTRQAILHINRPKHQYEGVKDFPCTMHFQFFIREGLLELDVVMRSQDVVKGFPYDVKWFMSRQLLMAEELGVPPGPYTHLVHSMHMYDKDLETIKAMQFDG